MNEGIFTASASKQRKIFSSVTKAKKELYKNTSETKPAVKEEKQMPSFQQLRLSLEEKTLTPAEKTKREEIAKAMERETPGMPMAKKMAIATAQAKKVTEAKDSREYDYEGDMSKSQLRSIIANAQAVHDMLDDNTNMAEWVQSKITLAADYISTVADYMKSEVNEAVSVKKANYSWGKMMTVHHGASTSYPLHPEHQKAIAKLGDGEKTSFKDETNSTVHAHREGDTVHLTRPKSSSTKTSVAHNHFNEEIDVAEGNPCWDGYKMLGMKDKGGKKVPNCIPEEQHYCAKHVYSNMFGEGEVVEGDLEREIITYLEENL